MNLKDLSKKILSLRDLRAAINEVKSLAKDAKVIPINPAAPPEAKPAPVPAPKEQDRKGIKQELGANKSYLRHLGLKDTGDGRTMSHMIGMPGANQNYEVKMDMHSASQGKPHMTVQHIDSTGRVQSQSPKLHATIGSAIKDLVHHSHGGKWSQE